MKETIEWFDYPDVKPPDYEGKYGWKQYIVKTESADKRGNKYYFAEWIKSIREEPEFYYRNSTVNIREVVMWAKMPRGMSNE